MRLPPASDPQPPSAMKPDLSSSEDRHSTADRLAAPPAGTAFATGAPRFPEADLQQLAAREGLLAAWQARVERLGELAAAGVGGDFSVAVRRGDGAWLLATDRFASHPLVYHLDAQGHLHFATRADELARTLQSDCSDLNPQIDPQALFDYLFHHVIPSPRTVFRNLKRLPPAHTLWAHEGRASLHRHWQASFRPQQQPDFNALRDEFRALVRQAVAERLPAEGPPVCFLSGGTDSSTVVGMAREVSGQAPLCYSIGFDAEGYDEMDYARLAAKAYGAEHHEYYISPDDLVRSIPAVAAHYDQPFGNSSVVPAFYCARLARLHGARGILAGDGGDELFGGNTRYAKEGVFEHWQRLPAWLRDALLAPLFDNPLTRALPGLRKGASYVRQARVPMPDRMQSYNLLRRIGLSTVFTPAFLAQVDPDAPRQAQRRVWNESSAQDTLVDRMLAFDWRYTLAENDLPKVTGSTSLAGLRVGFPLLDDRLLDFSLKLPLDYKLRGQHLRWFFKEALRGFLPDEIITKKKHGFGLPFGPWAVRHAGLHAMAQDSLRSLASRGFIPEGFARSLMEQQLPQHPGYYGEMVFILTMLEQWLRQHAPSYRVT